MSSYVNKQLRAFIYAHSHKRLNTHRDTHTRAQILRLKVNSFHKCLPNLAFKRLDDGIQNSPQKPQPLSHSNTPLT